MAYPYELDLSQSIQQWPIDRVRAQLREKRSASQQEITNWEESLPQEQRERLEFVRNLANSVRGRSHGVREDRDER